MVKKYLKNRKDYLENQIELINVDMECYSRKIKEMENLIEEIVKSQDEATKLFSVKAREDNLINNKDIEENKKNISECLFLLDELDKKKAKHENEIDTINQCLEQLENNVSRETLNEKDKKNQEKQVVDKNIDLSLIANKLRMCRKIIGSDVARVQVEIDEIIKIIDK